MIAEEVSCSQYSHLRSYQLLRGGELDSAGEDEVEELLQRFDLAEDVEESPLEEKKILLRAFFSSFADEGEGEELFHRVYEMLILFPTLELELLQSLLESNDRKVSKEMIEEFQELCPDNSNSSEIVVMSCKEIVDPERHSSCENGGICLSIDKNGVLVVVDDEDCVMEVFGISMNYSHGLNALYALQNSCFIRRSSLEFGVHDLQICLRLKGRADSSDDLSFSCFKISVTSAVFDYCIALEKMFDLHYNGWAFDGSSCTWTPQLEASLLNLLVSIDDDLVGLVSSWKALMSGFSSSMTSGMTNDLESMLQMVQSDASEALRTKSANSICRLHQVLAQFDEMSKGPMNMIANIPAPFLHAIKDFFLAKIQSSKTTSLDWFDALDELVSSSKRYCNHLKSTSFKSHKISDLESFISFYDSKLCDTKPKNQEEVVDFILDLTPSNLNLLENLKPSQLDSFMDNEQSDDIMCFMPTISLEILANPLQLVKAASNLSEKTFGDAVLIGSRGEAHIGGYTMRSSSNCSLSCSILTSLLNVGMAYVATTGSKLMAHFPMWRSTLRLQPNENKLITEDFLDMIPYQLKKRIKDMKRIFRNKIKKKLSFRLNFDLRNAISLLREHHGVECWVGPEMEEVWMMMASTTPPQLMAFQLYYGERLIACDFAHPVCGGKSVYVATRFSARGHSKTRGDSMIIDEDEAAIRTMQPGFILALAECNWLKEHGCKMWDLGGYTRSPLMQYKLDLTGQPKQRPHALYEFRNITEQKSNHWEGVAIDATTTPSLFSGVSSSSVLIDDVKIEHILGHCHGVK